MSTLVSCIYHGTVAHQRLQPLRHKLSYRVFNLFVDVDELPALSRRLRLFSYKGFNVFSIHDRNHGQSDGTSISENAWRLARDAKTGKPIRRIFMFCYPRLFGFVFNPLTVYYAFDADDDLRLTIYEVNNTFGERHTYVLPVEGNGEQHIEKQLYVSPFNATDGFYRFRVSKPDETLALGIALTTDKGPTLNAWFSGARKELRDRTLLRSLFSMPLLPLKVIGGIHWEALRLWLKGLRLVPHPAPPIAPATFGSTSNIKSESVDDPHSKAAR
jgi:uncharacterized protein